MVLVEARRLKPLQSALNTVLQSDPIALYESLLGSISLLICWHFEGVLHKIDPFLDSKEWILGSSLFDTHVSD